MNDRLPLSEQHCSCNGHVANQGHQKRLLFPTANITTTSLCLYGSPHTGSSCGLTLHISSKRSVENLMERRIVPRTAPLKQDTWFPCMIKEIQKSEGRQGVQYNLPARKDRTGVNCRCTWWYCRILAQYVLKRKNQNKTNKKKPPHLATQFFASI